MPDNDPLDGVTLPTSRRRILTATTGLGATSLAMGTAGAIGETDDDQDETGEANGDEPDDADDEAGDAQPFAAIEFTNQFSDGSEIVVDSTTLSDGGYVAIHDTTLVQGDLTGSVVGVTEYLDPGRHQAIEVEIDDPNAITEVALPARPLLPMPHLDTNDNEAYDFVETEGGEDGPYVKAFQAVIDAGLVTIEN